VVLGKYMMKLEYDREVGKTESIRSVMIDRVLDTDMWLKDLVGDEVSKRLCTSEQ